MGEISSTRMAGPPELMEREAEFARALRSVNGFHVQGNKLELPGNDKLLATRHAVE
jgi:heat shock protein HslJ